MPSCCRYGDAASYPVFSRLSCGRLPSIDGVISWLSVSTAPRRQTYPEASPVRLLMEVGDGYTGRALGGPLEGAKVELLRVEVVLSQRGIFGASEDEGEGRGGRRRSGGQRTRRTGGIGTTGTRRRSRSQSPSRQPSPSPRNLKRQAMEAPARVDSRGTSPVLTRLVSGTPHATFAVREGPSPPPSTQARPLGGRGGVDIAEEAEVHGFLSRLVKDPTRDLLMQSHGVVKMLTLLGLHDDRLQDMGLTDDEERRALLQGTTPTPHRIHTRLVCRTAEIEARSADLPLLVVHLGVATGIVEARQYLSSKRRLPSFATPIDPTNPYRLGGLAGWTARGECVELKRVGQASLEAQGRCAMAVSQSGSYVFRVTVPGYEPAESDVLCVNGPQPQPQPQQPPMRVGVWLRPKWAKCLLILTRTSQLAASDLDVLKGGPIKIFSSRTLVRPVSRPLY